MDRYINDGVKAVERTEEEVSEFMAFLKGETGSVYPARLAEKHLHWLETLCEQTPLVTLNSLTLLTLLREIRRHRTT